MRPALLTAMLGNTFVWLGLYFDLGRYYNLWHPFLPSMWSGHSVLFEVGICVLFYLIVLYSEFIPILLGIYLAFKIGDMVIRDTYIYLTDGSFKSIMFIIEMTGGVIVPLILLFTRKIRSNPRWLFISSILIVLGVALNRVNVFITAYTPPYAEKLYFPALL